MSILGCGPPVLASPTRNSSDHPPPSYPMPIHISEWDRRKEGDIKGRVRFPVFGMKPGPELTLFRRGTDLYKKTRTWSHHSPEGISKCNAFILVHNPSQVKATQPCVFKGNCFISVHKPLQSTNTLLSGPKAKRWLIQFREPLPENWVQSKP